MPFVKSHLVYAMHEIFFPYFLSPAPALKFNLPSKYSTCFGKFTAAK